MKEALAHTNQPIVFRRWSGKNYAVFSSLGKEIKIGQVEIEICDKAISKSSKTEIITNLKEELLQLKNDDEDKDLLENGDLEIISLLSITTNTDDSSGHSPTLINMLILNYLTTPYAKELELLYKNFKNEQSDQNKF